MPYLHEGKANGHSWAQRYRRPNDPSVDGLASPFLAQFSREMTFNQRWKYPNYRCSRYGCMISIEPNLMEHVMLVTIRKSKWMLVLRSFVCSSVIMLLPEQYFLRNLTQCFVQSHPLERYDWFESEWDSRSHHGHRTYFSPNAGWRGHGRWRNCTPVEGR